jgi:hypothetical protein
VRLVVGVRRVTRAARRKREGGQRASTSGARDGRGGRRTAGSLSTDRAHRRADFVFVCLAGTGYLERTCPTTPDAYRYAAELLVEFRRRTRSHAGTWTTVRVRARPSSRNCDSFERLTNWNNATLR